MAFAYRANTRLRSSSALIQGVPSTGELPGGLQRLDAEAARTPSRHKRMNDDAIDGATSAAADVFNSVRWWGLSTWMAGPAGVDVPEDGRRSASRAARVPIARSPYRTTSAGRVRTAKRLLLWNVGRRLEEPLLSSGDWRARHLLSLTLDRRLRGRNSDYDLLLPHRRRSQAN